MSAAADRGGPMLEHAVVVAIVAALALALPLGSWGSIADGIRRAVCAALQSPDCPSAAPGPPPPQWCQRSSAHSEHLVSLRVLGHYGQRTQWRRARFADGETWFVWRSSHNVGLALGAPGSRTSGAASREAEVGGDATWGRALIWRFGPRQQRRARAFAERVEASAGVSGAAAPPPHLGEPDLTLVTRGAEAHLRTEAGASGVLAQGGWSGRARHTVGVSRGDGAVSETYEVSGTIGAGGELLRGRAGAEGRWQAAIRGERSRDGALRAVHLSAELEGTPRIGQHALFGVPAETWMRGVRVAARSDPARTVVRAEVRVEPRTAAERATAESFLADYAGYGGVWRYFAHTWREREDFLRREPGPDAGPWRRLLYRRADAWATVGDGAEVTVGAEADGAGRAALAGARVERTRAGEATRGAWYLAEPRGGRRPVRPHDACVADRE